jgi:predicted dehydrogenase
MKVVIIGLGSIAKKHISALKAIDSSIEIIALRSSITAEAMSGIKNIYSWEAVSKENPDFIIISNPTYAHFDAIQKLKENQVPLFIEKPVFAKIGEAERKLIQEISKEKIPTYVACNLRFLQSIQEIKKLIRNERVNEVNVYCGSYLPEWRPDVDYRTIYSANRNMGGGVHLDLIHELDYVYWLFGDPQHTSGVFKNSSSLGIDAYDYANYIWEYKEFCISFILNYYRPIPKRSMEIVCKSGIYLVNLLSNTITFNDEVIFSSEQQTKDTYIDQLSFFINNVLIGKSTFNSIEEGYKILKLCTKE